jgi:hypothetical protein
MKHRYSMLTLVVILLVTKLFAADFSGVKMADDIKLDGKPLVLNGLGMRQKTIFHVNVYVGALYVEKKSHDPDEILRSSDMKRVELAFVHSASQSQVQDAFDEAYQANCTDDCAALKGPFEKLRSLMTALSVGDRLAFDIYPGKVNVLINSKPVGTVIDSNFPRALLGTWLGKNPPTESLKQAMLGK